MDNIVLSNYCAFCFPDNDVDEKPMAVVIFRGMSLCEKCFRGCFEEKKDDNSEILI